jgi:hypothetical protein
MTKISIQGSSTGGGGGGTGTVTSVALTTGTSGTNVNVSGSPITTAGTITVNIPIASAVNTGKLSSSDFTAFNNKQAALVSGTNIKTINSTTLLGSGDIAVQPTLVSGTNIKTVNGNTLLGSGDLVVSTSPAGTDGQVQYNNGGAFGGDALFNWDDINKRLGLGTATPLGILHLKTTGTTTRQVIDGDAGQFRIITFRTSGLQRFGLYVNNDAETGFSAGSNFAIRRYDDTGTLAGTPFSIIRSTGQVTIPENLTLSGSKLLNFIPETNARSGNFTINSTNQDTLCGSVIEVTGALTITIDASVRNGFNVSVIQMDANSSTFAVTGGLTLRNRQGHTKTFGQWATVTLYRDYASNLILAGDTAP